MSGQPALRAGRRSSRRATERACSRSRAEGGPTSAISFGDVPVRLGEKVESTHLCPDGLLQKFGGRQTSNLSRGRTDRQASRAACEAYA